MPNVYAAGAISGLTYEGAVTWRDELQRMFDAKGGEITVLDPMRGKVFLKETGHIKSTEYENVLATQKGITGRDRNDVYRSDALIVNLLGAQRVSIGTMIELGWADSWRIPIILVMEETGNLHEHAMVREVATYRVTSLCEAAELVSLMLTPRANHKIVDVSKEVAGAWSDGWEEGYDAGVVKGNMDAALYDPTGIR
jgi:nucleoside 2-deoxyribosyltransferase